MKLISQRVLDSRIQIRTFERLVEGQVIGRVSVIIQPKPKGRPSALIEDVWTHPVHRRQGIATSLTKEAMRFAASENCYKIILTCDPGGAAYKMYRSLGFRDHQQSLRIDVDLGCDEAE